MPDTLRMNADWQRALLVSLGALALYVLRTPPAAFDSLWAEDGAVFLQAALQQNGFSLLLTPYEGYLHFVPRLIAAVAVLFPLGWWPTLLVVGSALTVAGIAAAVYLATSSLGLQTRTRVLLAAVTVLAPALGYEMIGNAANLHTFMLWAALWVLLARPHSTAGALGWAVLVLVILLTEVQALFFVPMLVWQWRDRLRWPMRAAAVIGVGAQLAALTVSHREALYATPDLASWFNGFFLQAVMPAWIGSVRVASQAIAVGGWWLGYLAAVPFMMATVLILWRTSDRAWRLVVTAIWVAAGVIWTAGYVLNTSVVDRYAWMSVEELGSVDQLRYGVVPAMLLISLMVLLTDQGPSGDWRRVRQSVVGVLALVALIGLPLSWFGPHQSSESWTASVAEARQVCASEASESATLAVAPAFMAWTITVPCERLDTQPRGLESR
ncbi:MAG: hypothetical protein ACOYBP_05090 [Microbacteriaceae bacterium]